MKVKTSKGNWNIHGINMIPSDSCYQAIVAAIEAPVLNLQDLCKRIGHNGPVDYSEAERSITFCSF